jgi:hypothetical protein
MTFKNFCKDRKNRFEGIQTGILTAENTTLSYPEALIGQEGGNYS